MKMSVFGKEYSQIYDLLYKSKDYEREVEYLNKLIKKNYKKKIKNILDIGCGTGKHASLLVDKGYQLHGVDMSPQMISIAKKNFTKIKIISDNKWFLPIEMEKHKKLLFNMRDKKEINFEYKFGKFICSTRILELKKN